MSSKMNNRICINEWKELKIDSKRIVLESEKKTKCLIHILFTFIFKEECDQILFQNLIIFKSFKKL